MVVKIYSFCSELETQRTLTTSYHPEGNALIKTTNRTMEECLSKYIGQYQKNGPHFYP